MSKKTKSPPPSAAEFLAGFDPHLEELATLLREVVRSAVPGATEKVRVGWGLVGYDAPRPGGGRGVYFAGIAPQPKHDRVLLAFEWGIRMDDPERVLEGTGSQMRWIVLRSVDDLERADLGAYLRAAAEVALAPR